MKSQMLRIQGELWGGRAGEKEEKKTSPRRRPFTVSGLREPRKLDVTEDKGADTLPLVRCRPGRRGKKGLSEGAGCPYLCLKVRLLRK